MIKPAGKSTASALVLRPKRLAYAVYLAMSLGFTAGGAWMIMEGEAAGWLVAAFFGLGSVILVSAMLPGSAYLRLTPDGFTVCSLYRRHGFGWAEVGPFFPGRVSGRKMVLFNHAGPTARRNRRAASRLLAGAEGALPDRYGMTVEKLAALMNEWRDSRFRPGEITGAAELSPAEVSERLPVWEAISELWLDTEHGEAGLKYIAGRLAKSGFSLSRLEDIYRIEVAPVVHANLRQVAGEWAGFDRQWLEAAVLRHLARPDHRARAERQHAYMTELVTDDWRQVRRLVEELRHAGRGA